MTHTTEELQFFTIALEQKQHDSQQLRQRLREDDCQLHGTICIRCQSRSVRYASRQLRSMDEGPSACFQCTTCQHRWRMD